MNHHLNATLRFGYTSGSAGGAEFVFELCGAAGGLPTVDREATLGEFDFVFGLELGVLPARGAVLSGEKAQLLAGEGVFP